MFILKQSELALEKINSVLLELTKESNDTKYENPISSKTLANQFVQETKFSFDHIKGIK